MMAILSGHYQDSAQCSSSSSSSGVPTPGYLVPYYLRDIRSLFNHYASITERGVMYMTPGDLIAGLLALPTQKQRLSCQTMPLGIFEATDDDGNHLISYEELRVTAAMLSVNLREDLPTLFRLASEEGEAHATSLPRLSYREFAKVLLVTTQDVEMYTSLTSSSSSHVTGMLKLLFGEDGTSTCSVEDVRRLITTMKETLWAMDFSRVCPPHSKGPAAALTPAQCVSLIASHLQGEHPPPHMERFNWRKRHRAAQCITLPMWQQLQRAMEQVSDVTDVFSLCKYLGGKVVRSNIADVLRIAGLPPLSPPVLDLVFTAFDINRDGEVDWEEWSSVAQRANCVHYWPSTSAMEEARKASDLMSLIGRLPSCLSSTLSECMRQRE